MVLIRVIKIVPVIAINQSNYLEENIMKRDIRFRLIVNGTIVAMSKNLDMLKRKGARQKSLNPDLMVSIEDCRGMHIHYFFG